MTLIVSFLVLLFVFESISEWLNYKRFPDKVPREFEDSYDLERLHKARDYFRAGFQADLWKQGFFLVVTLAAILGGGFEFFDQWLRSSDIPGWLHSVLFLGGVALIGRVLSIPFLIHHVFSTETKFGFNKMTPETFVSDLIKGFGMAILLGGPLLAGAILLYESMGSHAWLWVWMLVMAFQLFFVFVAPVWIMPLFNKYTPLEEGPLKQSIENFAKKEAFAISGIFKMDGSKRSTKSNAYFTGLGKTKRIVLFDTLIEKLTLEELTAVLAHEIGHYKMGHIMRMLLISALSSFGMFWALGVLLSTPGLESWIGVSVASTGVSLLVLSYCFSPLSKLSEAAIAWVSRKHEFEADTYAARTYGKPQSLATALKKLSVDHLAHLTPHPLKVAMEYSHPPVLLRMMALTAQETKL